MENYTRKQLKGRWERAKKTIQSWDADFANMTADEVIPGVWEVRIFPRWIFKKFLDRKIFEHLDSPEISRNVSYDTDSDDSQEWGWYRWRLYFDTKEDCYILELDYDVKMEDKKALPLVRGILDIALVESADSMIGKFKWRIRWLQRIAFLRRIPPIFLFFFEMRKIRKLTLSERLKKTESSTGYPARNLSIKDEEKAIKWPNGCDPWVEGYEFRSFYPYSDYGKRMPTPEEPKAEEPMPTPEETRYARRRFRENKWTKKDST